MLLMDIDYGGLSLTLIKIVSELMGQPSPQEHALLARHGLSLLRNCNTLATHIQLHR